RSAFRLLGFVTSQFSNLLLDFACYILGSAFHLIAVHGVLLKRGSCAWPTLLRSLRTVYRRTSDCNVGLRGKYYRTTARLPVAEPMNRLSWVRSQTKKGTCAPRDCRRI